MSRWARMVVVCAVWLVACGDRSRVPDAAVLDGPGELDAPVGDRGQPDSNNSNDSNDQGQEVGIETGPAKELGSPPGCGAAPAPYTGPLCGPKAKPCKLLRDEMVQSTQVKRPDGPSLTLDAKGNPSMLFEGKSGGDKGYYAVRQSTGAWTVSQMPMLMTMGSLVRSKTGVALALVYTDSPGGIGLWDNKGSGWTKIETVQAAYAGWGQGLTIDSGGCLHAFIKTTSVDLAYNKRIKSWSTQLLGKGEAMGPIALSPAGWPHLAYWTNVTSMLHWIAPPGKAEQVSPNVSYTGDDRVVMAVTAGPTSQGTPHLFFHRSLTLSSASAELIYARREASGWKETQLGTTITSPCSFSSCKVGVTCKIDNSHYLPVAAVASGSGDLRLVLGRKHTLAQLTGMPNSKYGCVWNGTLTTTGELRLMWFTGGKPTSTVVAKGWFPSARGQAKLDAQGRIHIGLYEHDNFLREKVRYLMLGP